MTDTAPQNTADSARAALFETHVRPLLASHCARCHNADKMTSGIRVDQIAGIPEDRHLALLADIRKQIDSGAMPPEDEPPLTNEDRSRITSWIDLSIRAAREQG
ncbi:MAG: c-type cytochrome domain-containing protein, partial [Planctomycetaceae bacterium]